MHGVSMPVGISISSDIEVRLGASRSSYRTRVRWRDPGSNNRLLEKSKRSRGLNEFAQSRVAVSVRSRPRADMDG